MKGCLSCGRGFHAECLVGCKNCHPKPLERIEVTKSYKKRGKTATGLSDPLSTGRKRAAKLYPIDKEAFCEWKGMKNCGGGKRPVTGCLDGRQRDRHHGPVKDTTRNQEGNVHRICKPCHNHWHELNDLLYDAKDYGLLPHDPVVATVEELVKNQIDWDSGAVAKRFQLASSIKGKVDKN